MAEIGFYHLTRTPLDEALPRLVEKALGAGHRLVLRAPTRERLEMLDRLLWTYGKDTFLPHGTQADGFAERQPVWLTTGEDVPNGAAVLILVEAAEAPAIDRFVRVVDLFDGLDEAAVAAARERWRVWRAAGHGLVYWRQTPGGGWQEAARQAARDPSAADGAPL